MVPVAADDSVQTTEDQPVNIPVLANDSDGNGDSLGVNAVTQPLHGTAGINADNTVAYVPVPTSSERTPSPTP